VTDTERGAGAPPRGALRRLYHDAAPPLALIAIVLSTTGVADAARERLARVVSKPKPNAVLKLDRKGKFPARAIPKVASARRADRATRIGGLTAEQLAGECPEIAVDLGSWCLDSSPQPVPNEDAGKNSWFYATESCVAQGGWLPTAAQLVGAVERVKLASTIDDDPLTASIDRDHTDGRRDAREMSSTLITTRAGSSSAGSQGVTEGSTGDPRQGEPNPTPAPADPSPETLQYVTVYDNHDKGGFAGSKPVGQPESFRCAYAKRVGVGGEEEERELSRR